MDITHVILWLYILPMGLVLLPATLAFGRLGDMEGVTKEDIGVIAILPVVNLYTSFCLIDVLITSVAGYIKNGRG